MEVIIYEDETTSFRGIGETGDIIIVQGTNRVCITPDQMDRLSLTAMFRED